MRLSESEHTRVSDVIASAERSTSGEIFCVLAETADDYRIVPLAWAALVALVAPPALLWFGVLDPALFTPGWQVGSNASVREVAALDAALSALLFVLAYLLVQVAPIKARLTPRSLRRAAVHRAAVENFLAHGIHVTRERTGVLIFLSIGDHVAEIVADEAINSKVNGDVWGDAISTLLEHVSAGRLADGFIASIGKCGAVLAEHFPARGGNPNELPDKLIEI